MIETVYAKDTDKTTEQFELLLLYNGIHHYVPLLPLSVAKAFQGAYLFSIDTQNLFLVHAKFSLLISSVQLGFSFLSCSQM